MYIDIYFTMTHCSRSFIISYILYIIVILLYVYDYHDCLMYFWLLEINNCAPPSPPYTSQLKIVVRYLCKKNVMTTNRVSNYIQSPYQIDNERVYVFDYSILCLSCDRPNTGLKRFRVGGTVSQTAVFETKPHCSPPWWAPRERPNPDRNVN